MSASAETAERRLADDLAGLLERFRDEEWCTELYRALGGAAWSRQDGAEHRVAMSWSRAEELVNGLRRQAGREPLELAQTGGEGAISDVVAEELARLGWRGEPVDTSQHDPQRLTQPESPPPKGTGELHAPTGDSSEWKREAHREAEENRREHA